MGLLNTCSFHPTELLCTSHNAAYSSSSQRTTHEHSNHVCRQTRTVCPDKQLCVVLVHQYSKMGGCQALMRGMANCFAAAGFPVVTFDMRGAGHSTGSATFTGKHEVRMSHLLDATQHLCTFCLAAARFYMLTTFITHLSIYYFLITRMHEGERRGSSLRLCARHVTLQHHPCRLLCRCILFFWAVCSLYPWTAFP